MKFGIGGARASANVPSYKDAVELIKFCDSVGYDYAWFSTDGKRDSTVLMTACALNSSKIKLCTGVMNPYTRHPLVIARMIATLDEVSGGRAVLGLATGDFGDNLKGLGYDPKFAHERLKETAVIVKRLLSGEKVTFHGKFFNVDEISLGFGARKDIPIFVAGGGPRILEIAGEVGDGVILPFADRQLIKMSAEHIEKGAKLAGKNMKDLELVSWVPLAVTDRGDDLKAQLRSTMALNMILMRRDWVLAAGIREDEMKAVETTYVKGAHHDPALEKVMDEKLKKIITDRIFDLYTIIAPAGDCIARIRELGHIGISQINIWVAPRILEEKKRVMGNIASQVMSAFK